MRPLIIITILLNLGLSGCWDMRDVDSRANITAVGIDMVNGDENTEDFILEEDGPSKLRMTFEVPIFAALGGDENGNGNGNKSAWVISSTGNSPLHIIERFNTRVWRSPFFGFVRVLVIGEEMARRDLKRAIDFFNRHQQVARRMKIIIAKDEAKDVIEVTPEIEDFVGVYLDNLIEMVAVSNRIQSKNFGEVLIELSQTGNSIVPRVRAEDREVTLAGSAIIKNWELVGWLGELETVGSLFVQDRVKTGIITVGSVNSQTGQIGFVIRESITQIRVSQENGELFFVIEIATEGDIIEQVGGQGFDDEEVLAAVNDMLGQEIQRLVHATIQTLQHTFRVDVLGLRNMVHRQLPQYWRQIEKDWDEEHFPQARFQVIADVKTRRTGLFW